MATKWQCEKRIFKDTWIRNLNADTNMQITDGAIPGLYLRYSKNTNKISFYLGCRLRTTGQHKNLFLGKLNDYKNIDELKNKARKWRNTILEGGDPLSVERAELKKEIIDECSRITYKEAFGLYMNKYAKLHKKPRTIKSNIDQSRLYIEPRFGHLYLDEIKETDVLDAYAAWVEKTSFSTANKALSLLSSFWTWCEDYKYLPRDSNPCKYVKKGRNKKIETRVLSIEEYKAFFAVLDAEKKSKTPQSYFRLIKVLALTGCRCSEIRELKIEELDLDHKQIRLQDSKTGARTVKLSDAAVRELEIALADAKAQNSEYVFPCKTDPTMCVQDIRKPFLWALEKAGLPQMRIHDLRHSFISMGANTGQNMVAMRDAAGHSRITTTEGYTHLADEQTFIAVNNIANAICA